MPREFNVPSQIEDAFALLCAYSPDALLLLDPAPTGVMRIVDCNDLACQLYATTRAQLIGRSVAALGWTDDAPDGITAAPSDGQARATHEAVHRRADGAAVAVKLSLAPICHAGRDLLLATVRDITVRRRTEQRLAAHHAISRILAEADHFMAAVPPMLRIIGETLAWDLGALWCIDEAAGGLRRTACWRRPSIDARAFDAASGQATFPKGVGLPGEVWASGAPRWHADLRTTGNFPRLAIAAADGLRSAFAFPITGRDDIFGVMEFFSVEPRPPDAELLELVATIGHISGEFIERRRAFKAARASEARKGAILAAALDCIITIDHVGLVTEWNPAAEATFGYRRDEAIGREMAELIIPPALRDRHRAGLRHYLATGEGPIIGRRIELVAIRADGGELPIELTITAIPTDGPPMFTGFVRDIAERKRAEDAQSFLALASQELGASLDYETTLANVARLAVPRIADWCSINLLDEQGALERVAGLHINPVKQAALDDVRRRVPPDLPAVENIMPAGAPNQSLLLADVTDADLRRFARSDEQLQVYRQIGFRSAMVMPLRAGERPLGVIIFATDESQRRYGRDDLLLAEDLAGRIAVAIDNARLYRQVQASVHLRDEFLSVAAHELKTPVTAVAGYAQVLDRRMLRDQTASPRDRRAVKVIVEQAERLNRLIVALLDLSRIQTGSLALDRQPVDLCAMVARVAEELQPSLDRHTLQTICGDTGLIVDGDELRLEQVLQNLLQNAIKYSPTGGPITVEVSRRDRSAALTVRDHGIGIPEAARAHLFERFYRASNVDGRQISGLGIGLFVVHEVVTAHGGAIEVRSEEGQGSAFTVLLPLAA